MSLDTKGYSGGIGARRRRQEHSRHPPDPGGARGGLAGPCPVQRLGRIPTYLKRHGARLFYGGQEAWGSIGDNGAKVASRIREVVEETGAAKINIIAHSRGGIDARYAISTLGLGDRVASPTTMNTPHHGVRFADTATRLKEPVYRKLAGAVNYVFGLAGD